MSSHTQTVIAIVISIFGATGFWSFMQYIIGKLSEKKSIQSKAILGLLHNEIYSLAEQYIRRGWITIEEYDNLQYLYKPYERLGGNGTALRLMNEIRELPIQQGDSEETD